MPFVVRGPIPHEVAPLQSFTTLQTALQRYRQCGIGPHWGGVFSSCNLTYREKLGLKYPAI